MVATPQPSASVMVVRPSGLDWETCLLRRAAQSSAYAGLWVFPGGLIRQNDATPPIALVGLTAEQAQVRLARAPDTPPPTPEASLAQFVGAARELVEEAGILLVRAQEGEELQLADEALADIRTRVEAGTPLATASAELGVALGLDQLAYYARWITPEAMPQRFDTRFFLNVLPPGQHDAPDGREVTESIWVTAADALERNRAGTLPLHFVTLNHLRRFRDLQGLDELLRFAADKPVVPTMPLTREQNGRLIPYLPDELEGAW